MAPTVSVIIPTYNRKDFVTNAIDSVLKQTFSPAEIIVIDDGSTDGTGHVLKKYGSGIRYIYQENKGVSSARNTGIKLAEGEYITFLDSDDRWAPKKLDIQIRELSKHKQFRAAYTDEIWIRNGKRVNQKLRHGKHGGSIFRRCLPLCIISPSSVILHRDIIEEAGLFNENLPVCEDYDMWLRISSRFPVLYIQEKLIIKYGGHEDQLSVKYWGMDRYRIMAIRKVLDSGLLNTADYNAAVNELRTKCSILIKGFARRNKEEEKSFYEKIQNNYGLKKE